MRRLSKISVDVRVSALIGVVSAGAGGALVASLSTITNTVSAEPRRVASMLALTLVLQLFSVPVYGRGGVGVSAIGILATAFLLNTGTAIARSEEHTSELQSQFHLVCRLL